jgi:hypothetical protein
MKIDACGYQLMDNVFVIPNEEATATPELEGEGSFTTHVRSLVVSQYRTVQIVGIWVVLAVLLIADIVILIMFDDNCKQSIREWLIVIAVYLAIMVLLLALFEVTILCFRDES